MVKGAFVEVLNRMINSKDEIICSCEEILEEMLDTTRLSRKTLNLQSELKVNEDMLRKMIEVMQDGQSTKESIAGITMRWLTGTRKYKGS